MGGHANLRLIHTAADGAEAEAIRDALTGAGIAVEVVAIDGTPLAEVYVPAADEVRAGRIIDAGRWPRLA